MLTFIPRRYTSAKWQARVTNPEKQFIFSNGMIVTSLFEIKTAMSELPEEVLQSHVNDERHDIANWVEFVVMDKELADTLREKKHRGGRIVNLEREMMGTLNLPDYVARNWLEGAYKEFSLSNGESVKGLEDLAGVLGAVSDEAVKFHLERVPNDIARWVLEVVGDYLLAELIEESSNRGQMQRFVSDHVEMLKEAAE